MRSVSLCSSQRVISEGSHPCTPPISGKLSQSSKRIIECTTHHQLHTPLPIPLLPQSSWSYVPNSSHLYCSNSSHSIMKCLMSFTSPQSHSTHLSSFTMSHIFLSPNSSALQNLTTCSQNCNFTQLYGPPSNSDTYISGPFSLYNHFKVHFFSTFLSSCQFYELLSIPLFLPPSCCHFYPFIVIFLQTTYSPSSHHLLLLYYLTH